MRDTEFPALATSCPTLWPVAPAWVDGTSRLPDQPTRRKRARAAYDGARMQYKLPTSVEIS